MDAIFHEKQEGSLCAQHCLNALLQGSYFTAVDLAELARQLDDAERSRMAEAGLHSDDYQRFLEQPSSNFDDSGFFSIQVIQKAVKVWGLELLPFNSKDAVAVAAQREPTSQKAYICNFREHWFAIRHLGKQWFNLNSLLTGPELISDTYLSMFLTQLQQEGYSIFVVLGSLPECEADQLLRIMPADQPVKPQLINDNRQAGTAKNPTAGAESGGIDGNDLEQALRISRQMADSEDSALQKALAMSMQGFEDFDLPSSAEPSSSAVPQPSALIGAIPGPSTAAAAAAAAAAQPEKPSADEVRQKRQAFLDRLQQQQTQASEETPAERLLTSKVNGGDESSTEESIEKSNPAANSITLPCPPSEMTEEQMIQEAIKLSMQNS